MSFARGVPRGMLFILYLEDIPAESMNGDGVDIARALGEQMKGK